MKTFYDKNFTKTDFFEEVKDALMTADIDSDLYDKLVEACDYEIEKIAAANARKGSKNSEPKDFMQSDYVQALQAKILPLVTGEPKTAKQLSDEAGESAPSGKAFPTPWIARVLNKIDNINKTTVVVERTDKDGLVSQVKATAYSK